MNWQGTKAHDRNTEREVQGAQYCVTFLEHRPHWHKAFCQWYGEQVYKRLVKTDPGFADGFREMAYVIGKTRY